MGIHEQLGSVCTRQDLAGFVRRLREDLVSNEPAWENPTLDRFLEALAAWCDDMDGFFEHAGESQPEQPSWNLIATMLLAASMYE